jgi:hypothetical protein
VGQKRAAEMTDRLEVATRKRTRVHNLSPARVRVAEAGVSENRRRSESWRRLSAVRPPRQPVRDAIGVDPGTPPSGRPASGTQ